MNNGQSIGVPKMNQLKYYKEIFATLANNPDAVLEIEASMNYWCEVPWQEAFINLASGTRIRVKPTPDAYPRTFDQWAKDYALEVEPLTRESVRADCYAAFIAGQASAVEALK